MHVMPETAGKIFVTSSINAVTSEDKFQKQDQICVAVRASLPRAAVHRDQKRINIRGTSNPSSHLVNICAVRNQG